MRCLTLLAFLSLSTTAMAGELFDSGKLLATGGVSQLEGAGGGLASWAMITGYGSEGGVGANVHCRFPSAPKPEEHTTVVATRVATARSLVGPPPEFRLMSPLP